MATEKETQDYVSQYYEKRYSGNGLLYHRYLAEKMMVPFQKRKDWKILDVGCGTGFMSECFPYSDIVGIDISDGMLKKNKNKCFKGDAENIPFPDKFFDGIICRALLHHLPSPKNGIQEMRRVLKPGGYISILETNQSIINKIPRKLMTYTKRFSRDHKNFEFNELISLIKTGFIIDKVEFIGYLAYPLIGFPDFIPFFNNIPEGAAKWLIALDERLSRGPLKRLSFNLHVLATK